MSRVSRAQAAVKDSKTGVPVGEIPGIDYLLKWYEENAPNGNESGIVHGDFKCDNMVCLQVIFKEERGTEKATK